AGSAPAPVRWALALALAASVLVALRVELPPYFANEGRYAAVAREMVVLGDYATPHLDFVLFLNKPPLLYWLTALLFHVIGPSEWARLVSVAAGAVTLFATCRLGALLYGEPAGLVAGLALATSLGFVLAAFRHPGFAWDYVVNQHLLFFLDRKLPRDSSGDPLGSFWAAYAGRATPWILLVPVTLAEAVRGARRAAPGAPRATALVWAWAGGLLLFFSCAPSRLEHYSM